MRTAVLMIVMITFITNAITLHGQCAEISYNEFVYSIPTIKAIEVKGVNSASLICNGEEIFPTTIKKDSIKFVTSVTADSSCVLSVVCEGNVIKIPLKFVPSKPMLTVKNVTLSDKLYVYVNYSLPVKGRYKLTVCALGVCNDVKLTSLSGSLIVPLDAKVLEPSNAVRVTLKLRYEGLPLFSNTFNVRTLVLGPIPKLLTQTLFNGKNEVCFLLQNPYGTSFEGVEGTVASGDGYSTFSLSLPPMSSKRACVTLNMSMPSIAGTASENATSVSYSQNVTLTLYLKYRIANNTVMRTYDFVARFISLAWPAPTLIASTPLVLKVGSPFSVTVYITNPSPMTFPLIKVYLVPRDGTLVVPLGKSVAALVNVQPMASLPTQFYFRLDGCNGSEARFWLVIESTLPNSVHVSKIPISFPAACAGPRASISAAQRNNGTNPLMVVPLVLILVFLGYFILRKVQKSFNNI